MPCSFVIGGSLQHHYPLPALATITNPFPPCPPLISHLHAPRPTPLLPSITDDFPHHLLSPLRAIYAPFPAQPARAPTIPTITDDRPLPTMTNRYPPFPPLPIISQTTRHRPPLPTIPTITRHSHDFPPLPTTTMIQAWPRADVASPALQMIRIRKRGPRKQEARGESNLVGQQNNLLRVNKNNLGGQQNQPRGSKKHRALSNSGPMCQDMRLKMDMQTTTLNMG